MSLFNNKRAEIVSIILIIIIITISIGWIINLGSRECRSNSQCPADNYCGSDFSCHKIPIVEKTIVKNNLIVPSIIIGIAIIFAAIVLRFGKISLRKNNKAPEKQFIEDTNKNRLKIP